MPQEIEARKTLENTAEDLRRGASVPISRLTLFVQRAFGGLEEPDWQSPSRLWTLRDDPAGRTVADLDAVVRSRRAR